MGDEFSSCEGEQDSWHVHEAVCGLHAWPALFWLQLQSMYITANPIFLWAWAGSSCSTLPPGKAIEGASVGACAGRKPPAGTGRDSGRPHGGHTVCVGTCSPPLSPEQFASLQSSRERSLWPRLPGREPPAELLYEEDECTAL